MSTATVSMDAATATGIRDFLLGQLEMEFGATKKVLNAIQPGDWKPDPKSRSANEIAKHIVASEIWFLNGVAANDFTPQDEASLPQSLDAIRNYYETEHPKAIAKIRQLSGQHMSQIGDFYGMKLPLTTLLGFAVFHTVHHRGQLATYLRPLGGKCPDIYGGSADEPWQG
jgi:uncharacterized damage-inducible protein DinB